jgi:hypothetical protein
MFSRENLFTSTSTVGLYRVFLSLLVIGIASVAPARGSTLTLNAKLEASPDPMTSGLWHVSVFVQSLGNTDSGNQGDGGVAGLVVDMISTGVGRSAPVQAAATAPNSRRAKTTFNLSVDEFGTQFRPFLLDATPAYDDTNQPLLYNADGDLDAIGGYFFDSNYTYANTTVGRNGFQSVFTVDWQLTSPGIQDHLEIAIANDGAEYYDLASSHSRAHFLSQYAAIHTMGIDIGPVPEPTSLALMTLGVFGLVIGRWIASYNANLQGLIDELIQGTNFLVGSGPAPSENNPFSLPEPPSGYLIWIGLLIIAIKFRPTKACRIKRAICFWQKASGKRSRQDIGDHVGLLHAGEFHVQALEAFTESLVVNAQEMQHRGM